MKTKPKTPASIKCERISFRMPQYLIDSLKVQARREGTNPSRFIREAVEQRMQPPETIQE